MSKLRNLVERALMLREDRRGINADLADLAKEAKALGYDGKVFGQVVRRAEMAADVRLELDALIEAYEAELAGPIGPVSGDARLQAAFGAKPDKKNKAAARTAAWLNSGLGD